MENQKKQKLKQLSLLELKVLQKIAIINEDWDDDEKIESYEEYYKYWEGVLKDINEEIYSRVEEIFGKNPESPIKEFMARQKAKEEERKTKINHKT